MKSWPTVFMKRTLSPVIQYSKDLFIIAMADQLQVERLTTKGISLNKNKQGLCQSYSTEDIFEGDQRQGAYKFAPNEIS